MGQAASEVIDPQDAEETTTDPEVERLVEDIEETREEMTGTVEEIGDRLDPRNIVADAKDTIREATVGKVEQMASTASDIATDATESVREAGTGLVDTITRNPLPAAMVGIGIGWLVMSGRNQSASQRYGYQSNARRPDPVQQAKARADSMASDVSDTVDRVTSRAGELAEDVPYQLKSTATRLGDTAAEVFDSSPLAVGAIAVAAGALLGLALPPTTMERDVLTEPAQKAIRKVEEVATDALGQVEDQARDVEEQARQEDRQARPH